jgi:hypothetical protein
MTRPAVVFGDVHGDASSLEKLIRKIRARFGQEVDIYSVGDLVDRGPDSKGVIEICIREGIQGIIGNYEIWLHRYFDSRDPKTIERRLKHLVPQSHKDWILGLPVWRKIVVGGEVYRLVHAGVKQPEADKYTAEARRRSQKQNIPFGDALCNTIAELEPAYMMWQSPNLQDPNLYHFDDGTQIFGHIPRRNPIITKGWMAIDTGAGTRPPYTITAVVLPYDGEILQANKLSEKLPDTNGYHDFEG